MQKYYMLTTNGTEADVYIYGDITSWEWLESDTSSYTLSKELAEIEADRINVHINSYGGEVAEGLAIYNSLKNHPAKIVTICDGFACSSASIVFMAGDERIMNYASLLMIHNAWNIAIGDADYLRKAADDLEKISETAANAYREAGPSVSDDELQAMLDNETWITPAEALEWGFATSISKKQASGNASASAQVALFELVRNAMSAQSSPKTPEPPPADPPVQISEPPEEPKTKSRDYVAAMAAFFMPTLKGEN